MTRSLTRGVSLASMAFDAAGDADRDRPSRGSPASPLSLTRRLAPSRRKRTAAASSAGALPSRRASSSIAPVPLRRKARPSGTLPRRRLRAGLPGAHWPPAGGLRRVGALQVPSPALLPAITVINLDAVEPLRPRAPPRVAPAAPSSHRIARPRRAGPRTSSTTHRRRSPARPAWSSPCVVATSAIVCGVLALSLQTTLGNILGGVAPARPPDPRRRLDPARRLARRARVREIRWRHTVVETRNWDTIIVPNATLLSSNIIILGKREGSAVPHRMWVYFCVDFRYPPSTVIDVAGERARAAADRASWPKTPRRASSATISRRTAEDSFARTTPCAIGSRTSPSTIRRAPTSERASPTPR